jgi:hypothetical protein
MYAFFLINFRIAVFILNFQNSSRTPILNQVTPRANFLPLLTFQEATDKKNDRPVLAASSLWQQVGEWWKRQQRSRRLALDCHHGCLAT